MLYLFNLEAQTKTMYVENKSFETGDEFTIAIWAENVTNMEAFQFSLDFGSEEFVAIDYSLLSQPSIIDEANGFRYLWFDNTGQNPVTINNDQTWMLVTLIATTSGTISDVCSIGALQGEINEGGQINDIELVFSDDVPNCLTLLSNYYFFDQTGQIQIPVNELVFNSCDEDFVFTFGSFTTSDVNDILILDCSTAVGSYIYTVELSDGTLDEEEITIFDPQNYCQNEICHYAPNYSDLELDENGEGYVSLDFLTGGFLKEECKDDYQLGIEENGVWVYYSDSIPVNCSHLGNLYVVIDNFAPEFPKTADIFIVDPNNYCNIVSPDHLPLSIRTSFSGPWVENVSLNGTSLSQVNTHLFEIPEVDILADNNIISFDGLNTGVNGISTLDQVLTMRHILGFVEPEPLEAILGDIDRSGYLGINDLIETRLAILGIKESISEFVFLQEDIQFDSSFDPFDFGTEVYEYHFDGADADTKNFTFNAYVSGDVNQSAQLKGADSETRNIKELSYDDIYLTAGEKYESLLTLSNPNYILGLQFNLDLDEIEILDHSSTYDEMDLMTSYLDNKFNVSFLTEEAKEYFEITISFIARKDGYLSDYISLGDYVNPSVVDKDLNEEDVTLVANSVLSNDDINISSVRVYPNPTVGNTTVELSNHLSYDLKVINLKGQVISTLKGIGKTIQLNPNVFTENGIYLLSLTTPNEVFTTKLIVE